MQNRSKRPLKVHQLLQLNELLYLKIQNRRSLEDQYELFQVIRPEDELRQLDKLEAKLVLLELLKL